MASSPPDGGGGKDVFVHISPVDLMVLICASGGQY
jgi:cold shock CspA family protein